MKPQFISTDAGEELVIISRTDYEMLAQRAAAAFDEEANDVRAAAGAEADLAAGRDIAFPLDVAEAILDGESRLRAIRKWRQHTQAELAALSGLAQSAISAMEKGGILSGSLSAWRDLAKALNVPLAVLIDA
ncbi:MAG: helix-turn-helix domain-containing protein [Beijerinckiaceae bacterium]|nr:helix-turn-helix domain-containing protein [Beijerinckiaceae bacterium]